MPLAVKSILDGRGYIGKADFTTSATLQVGGASHFHHMASISWQPEGLDRWRVKTLQLMEVGH